MEVNVVTIVLGVCLFAAIVAVPVWKISARFFFKGGVKINSKMFQLMAIILVEIRKINKAIVWVFLIG